MREFPFRETMTMAYNMGVCFLRVPSSTQVKRETKRTHQCGGFSDFGKFHIYVCIYGGLNIGSQRAADVFVCLDSSRFGGPHQAKRSHEGGRSVFLLAQIHRISRKSVGVAVFFCGFRPVTSGLLRNMFISANGSSF